MRMKRGRFHLKPVEHLATNLILDPDMKCVFQVLHYSYNAYDRYAVDGLLNLLWVVQRVLRLKRGWKLELRAQGTLGCC